jgi:predicted ferric reductase
VSILKKWPINQPWAAPQLGQYVFLNFPEVSKWEWHPYTLASSPLEEHMEVNIKKLGDHTKQLVESCQNGDHPVVRVDGPYGKVSITIITPSSSLAPAPHGAPPLLSPLLGPLLLEPLLLGPLLGPLL